MQSKIILVFLLAIALLGASLIVHLILSTYKMPKILKLSKTSISGLEISIATQQHIAQIMIQIDKLLAKK